MMVIYQPLLLDATSIMYMCDLNAVLCAHPPRMMTTTMKNGLMQSPEVF